MLLSRTLILDVLLAALYGHTLGSGPLQVQQDWLFPVYPDYTTTITLGDTYEVQWDSNLKNWFSSWCAVCGDPSHVDLWVQTGHDDDSQYKIASGVDVNTTFSLPWTVNIGPKNATIDSVWVLRFVQFDATPNNISGDSISSSLFYVKVPDALKPSSSTSSAATKKPAATSSPQTTKSPSGDLTTAAEAGIGVGVGVAVILILAGCYYFFKKSKNQSRDQGRSGEMVGPGQYAPREQPWAYKMASGNVQGSHSPDGRFSKGLGLAEMPSDGRVSELPGDEHAWELGVERRI